MNIEYYVIYGRGEDGTQFQLARLEDESGNNYKGKYDMARHFSSIDDMKDYVAKEVVNKPVADLKFAAMSL